MIKKLGENDISMIDQLSNIQNSLMNLEYYFALLLEEKIKEKLSLYFKDDKEIEIYKLSNGIMTTRQIGDLVGVSKNTVSDIWKEWLSVGIVETNATNRPYKAKYSLLELTSKIK